MKVEEQHFKRMIYHNGIKLRISGGQNRPRHLTFEPLTRYFSCNIYKLTTPTGKPVGFLLPSLACNRTSFSDFGIQV